jgi:hypothetical protein
MNENQIVSNLLDFYHKKGIDLYMVIDDPMFKNLSLDTKIAVIRKYADKLGQSTPRGYTKSDISSVIKEALFGAGMAGAGALMTAAGAAKLFSNGKINYGPVLSAGIAGGILGSILPIANKANEVKTRTEFGRQLDEAVTDQTDSSAFNVLAMRNLQQRFPYTTNPMLKKLVEKAEKHSEGPIKDNLIEETKNYNKYYLDNPLIDGDPEAEAKQEIDRKHKELVDAIKSYRQAQD